MEDDRPTITEYLVDYIHYGVDKEDDIKASIAEHIDEDLPFHLNDREYALFSESISRFLDNFIDDAYARAAAEDREAEEDEREYNEAKKGEY